MSRMETQLHLKDDYRAESTTAGASHWVEIFGGGSNSVTFFVKTQAEAERIAAAFNYREAPVALGEKPDDKIPF